MPNSDASTVPNTPESGSEKIPTLDEGTVFAWLRPLNLPTSDAFDSTVNTVIKYPSEYNHQYRFLHCDSRQGRAQSVFTDDDDSIQPESSAPVTQWAGAFGLTFTQLPHNPAKGWDIGTNRAKSTSGEVDLLLAPQNSRMNLGIAGNHARLALHNQSCRISLEAKHTVTIGINGAKSFRQSKRYVLEHGEIVLIGLCAYTFQYTDYFFSAAFDHDITQYMRKYCESHWSMNDYISPSSVGLPISLSNYYCSPRAFAQGTFGKISAGWSESGEVVAIKTFKKAIESEISSHIELMEYIGRHDRILQLLKCVGNFDTGIPEAYCIYTPLAVASLSQVIAAYTPDIEAQLALSADYLSGLAFFHDQKGITHRDISPNNLVITSLHNPKGIIIDLDSATRSETSTDHMRGTVPFLAPEIMALKHRQVAEKQPPSYGRSVDTWALGLAIYAMCDGRPFRWQNPQRSVTYVTPYAHRSFQNKLAQDNRSAVLPETKAILNSIRRMIVYEPEGRASASESLARILAAQKDKGRGTIVSNRKRPLED
ncbi:MAG: hypothetical protein Q9166_005925 [cf. Caloplaca sp. 2 TL-2023]